MGWEVEIGSGSLTESPIVEDPAGAPDMRFSAHGSVTGPGAGFWSKSVPASWGSH
jgi:hypothetical protein